MYLWRCAGAFELQALFLDSNQLQNPQEIRALSLLEKLTTLTLAGNPIIERLGPRAVDVLSRNSCPSLQTLDGRTLGGGPRSMRKPILDAKKEGTGQVFAGLRGSALLPVPLWDEVAEQVTEPGIDGGGSESIAQLVTLQPVVKARLFELHDTRM